MLHVARRSEGHSDCGVDQQLDRRSRLQRSQPLLRVDRHPDLLETAGGADHIDIGQLAAAGGGGSSRAVPHPHACTATVLWDELDARGFESAADGIHVGGRDDTSSFYPLNRREADVGGLSQFAGRPPYKSSGTPNLRC